MYGVLRMLPRVTEAKVASARDSPRLCVRLLGLE